MHRLPNTVTMVKREAVQCRNNRLKMKSHTSLRTTEKVVLRKGESESWRIALMELNIVLLFEVIITTIIITPNNNNKYWRNEFQCFNQDKDF